MTEPVPLSVALRRASRVRHDESNDLVRSYSPVAFAHPRVWLALLEQFHLIFSAFEDALKGEPAELRPLLSLYRSFDRSVAFEADIRFFAARDRTKSSEPPATEVQPVAAVNEWRERIRTLSKEDPILLIAHIHTMFSAILLGGSVLRGMQRRAMALGPNEGGAFATFGKDRGELKKELRERLDSLEVSDEVRDRLCREKGEVFRFSDRVIVQAIASVPEGSDQTLLYTHFLKRLIRSPEFLVMFLVCFVVVFYLLRLFLDSISYDGT